MFFSVIFAVGYYNMNIRLVIYYNMNIRLVI
jgi:hypothetical protein